MLEKPRNQVKQVAGGPGGLGDVFEPGEEDSGTVQVSHGPFAEGLPAGGMTVAQIRNRYADRFDIDPDSVAILDGSLVGDDTRVRGGQVLTFSRRVGAKGHAGRKVRR